MSFPIRSALFIALPLIVLTACNAHAQEGSQTVEAAAKKAFDQGEVELAKGNFKGAATLLKTAVRIQPKNAKYHHRLGKAFMGLESYHEMWTHYHKASFHDHANEEYANDFLKMWMYHDREAVFNYGTPMETVVKSIGPPDVRLGNRLVYGFMAVDFPKGNVSRVIDLRGYNDEAAVELETVTVATNIDDWKVAHHQVSRRDDNLELTRNDEAIQEWTELLSMQRFPMLSRSAATVRGMVDTMRDGLKQTDPKVEFVVVNETPTEVFYHWRTNPTEKHPAQHEVAKIFKGQKDFYRVAYVKKTSKLADAEFDLWSKAIGDAKLGPANKLTKVDSSKVNLTSFELGKQLGFAALLRGQHGPEQLVKKTLLQVSKHAQTLNVGVPAPPALTDSKTDDLASAIHYLLNTAGKPIYNTLQERNGDTSPALFELGTKSTLATMLYAPGDSTAEALGAAIQRSAIKAQLDEKLWRPLVDGIGQQESQDEVRAAIQTFQKSVVATLSE